jgi:hypothetical protein
MRLKELLLEKKSAILHKWFDIIVESYPPDTSKFLKKQKNRFANPVGSTILEGIEVIFDELLERGSDTDRLRTFLENIVKVRAVQNFKPSQALSFILLLKKIIRDELNKQIKSEQLADELFSIDSEIDGLTLLAFDVYMQSREKIYEIKANESKRMNFRLLQRARIIVDPEEQEPGDVETNKLP